MDRLDRVFEIGQLFCNEGIDMKHNPEFTTCEFYCVHWDYHDLTEVTEQLLTDMVLSLTDGYAVEYTRADGEVLTIHFKSPRPDYSMLEALEYVLPPTTAGDSASTASPFLTDSNQINTRKMY